MTSLSAPARTWTEQLTSPRNANGSTGSVARTRRSQRKRQRGITRPFCELGVRARPVALDVDRKHGRDTVAASCGEERDVPAERVPGDGDALEPELVDQPEQVAFVLRVTVGITVLAEPVPAEVERDHTQPVEERDDAEPVGRVARQAVQQDDGRPVASLGVCAPSLDVLRQRFFPLSGRLRDARPGSARR